MTKDANDLSLSDEDSRAADYVLGTLSADERRAVERDALHDRDLAARIGRWQDDLLGAVEAAPVVTPSPEVWASLEATLDDRPPPGSITSRAGKGEWIEIAQGVEKKSLFLDRALGEESYLLRFAPGGHLPAHSHTQKEECLVLEGEMVVGETRYFAGDYHAVLPGMPHMPITSRTGGLVYIRSELHGG